MRRSFTIPLVRIGGIVKLGIDDIQGLGIQYKALLLFFIIDIIYITFTLSGRIFV